VCRHVQVCPDAPPHPQRPRPWKIPNSAVLTQHRGVSRCGSSTVVAALCGVLPPHRAVDRTTDQGNIVAGGGCSSVCAGHDAPNPKVILVVSLPCGLLWPSTHTTQPKRRA
jgi:hypothetical protein